VVLITLDSLAASHLGCYGYERDTSPYIDAFAAGATLYQRAFATAPWTLPTHASMMTGRFPFEHGAHTFKINDHVVREYPLDESFLTLAEALKQEGFETAAFTANTAYLDPRWNLSQGFDVYENKRLQGEHINQKIFDWLDSHRSDRFFLFINYMDTHGPYNTRKPRERPDFLDHVSTRKTDPMFDDLTARLIEGDEPHPEAELRLLGDLYDIAIANVDEYLQALFDRLRDLGLYDELMIVVTSDHGEYFGEHGLVEHSKDDFREALPALLGEEASAGLSPTTITRLTAEWQQEYVYSADVFPSRSASPAIPREGGSGCRSDRARDVDARVPFRGMTRLRCWWTISASTALPSGE
jgi:arylsulfatase A-like enzyme